MSCGITEVERIFLNWENEENSLRWRLGINMIQIVEANLKCVLI